MRLDFKNIGKSILVPFAFWLVAVLGITFGARQPGVVCATPMAWLMALWVGMRCVAYSRSALKTARLTEAAVAGGLFGLLQGILFLAIMPLMGSIEMEERQKAILWGVIMIVFGAVISAVLSLAIAATAERKRAAS
jgi:hypothetical protein